MSPVWAKGKTPYVRVFLQYCGADAVRSEETTKLRGAWGENWDLLAERAGLALLAVFHVGNLG